MKNEENLLSLKILSEIDPKREDRTQKLKEVIGYLYSTMKHRSVERQNIFLKMEKFKKDKEKENDLRRNETNN